MGFLQDPLRALYRVRHDKRSQYLANELPETWVSWIIMTIPEVCSIFGTFQQELVAASAVMGLKGQQKHISNRDSRLWRRTSR